MDGVAACSPFSSCRTGYGWSGLLLLFIRAGYGWSGCLLPFSSCRSAMNGLAAFSSLAAMEQNMDEVAAYSSPADVELWMEWLPAPLQQLTELWMEWIYILPFCSWTTGFVWSGFLLLFSGCIPSRLWMECLPPPLQQSRIWME